MGRYSRVTLVAQGFYYAITGLWPLLHLASFEAVTGPKTDDWLVRMVGVLAFVIGTTLLTAAPAWPPSGIALRLAAGSALSFAFVDVVTVAAGTIRPIYLVDAAFQFVFLVGALGARVSMRAAE